MSRPEQCLGSKTKFAGQNCPVRILRDSKEFSNQLDIAVKLNQHFINVGPNLAKVIRNTAGDLSISDDINDIESVMNYEMTKVLNYCSITKLSVNMKKTNFMLITSPLKNVTHKHFKF